MPWRTLAPFVAAVAAILIAVTAYAFVAADRDRRAAEVSERIDGLQAIPRSDGANARRAALAAIEGAELREHRRAWLARIALADAIFVAANVLLLALVVAAGLAARAEMRRRERRAQERLELIAVQERILGIVSHDLRTPLSAIEAGATVLSRSSLPVREARIAALMQSSSRRMERIIRDLLDYTRQRANGGIPLSLRGTDLGEICARVIEEAALTARAVTLDLHRDGDLSGEWDPDRLEQVVGNLVGNAVHHAPRGTVVRVRAVGEEEVVLLEVENEGPPVPPEAVRSIFDPFQTGPGEAGGPRSGVGLGLFIVRSLVEAHGGTVDVESAPGHPVTFRVRLPRAPPPPEGASRRFWRPARPRSPDAPMPSV